MKIALNKEYAFRHGGVAALFFGLGLWFLYDAIFVYPSKIEGEHHTTVEFQYSMAGILLLAAVIVGVRLFNNYRYTLEWNDEEMWGTATGGAKVKFSDIKSCDKKQWESKGIIAVYTKESKRYVFDSWHHTGVKELCENQFFKIAEA